MTKNSSDKNKGDDSKKLSPFFIEISHSSISMARSCPKKYHWRYVEGLKPITKPVSLALGTVIHDAFDMFYTESKVGGYTPNIEVYIIKKMDEQIANSSLTEQEDLHIIKHTALAMWRYFPYKDLSEFQEIKSEKEFKVRLGNRKISLIGKSDRLLKREGKWWVGELKTTGLPLQAFKNRMSVSDQVTAYMYAWRKKGYPVEGVIFDVIKKPLLRKGVNENCLDFCNRILSDYKANQKKYYERHYEYRTDSDIERWVKDTERIAKDIRKIWKGDVYRNPDACFNYNAECPYKKICFADKPDPLTVQLYYEKKGEA